MYAVIQNYSDLVINSIAGNYVAEYEWLIQNRDEATNAQYQQRYKQFWVMHPARLSDAYYQIYFEALHNPNLGNVGLAQLPQEIYTNALRVDGALTCQFSFASKLLHMHDTSRPIYDSRVARFFLSELPRGQNYAVRAMAFENFYTFLQVEYQRVIQGGLLAEAIAQFRATFQPQAHTDEKIIDWLIWAFGGVAGDALQNGEIVFG